MFTKLYDITKKYSNLPYMTHEQALYMREIILINKCHKLCELGHLHGKSSIYFGSILEEQGYGNLHTFDLCDNLVCPSIFELSEEFKLNRFIKPILSAEGYTWDLLNLLKKKNQSFDFCYIDGGHTFEITALAFFLIDILLDINGILVFDDLMWNLNDHIRINGDDILKKSMYRRLSPMQRRTPPVKLITESIMPNFKYKLLDVPKNFGWAVYQKMDC